MGFWRLFGPFSRLFFGLLGPRAGRLFRDFFETFWLLAPRLLLPGPRNLNGRGSILANSLEIIYVYGFSSHFSGLRRIILKIRCPHLLRNAFFTQGIQQEKGKSLQKGAEETIVIKLLEGCGPQGRLSGSKLTFCGLTSPGIGLEVAH